jgi:broad specificity phosphatase PhoE
VTQKADFDRVHKVFAELRAAFSSLTGNLLIVSHYHTMQVLFDELTEANRSQVDSYNGKHVGSASVFVWDPTTPKRIELLDLTRTGEQH